MRDFFNLFSFFSIYSYILECSILWLDFLGEIHMLLQKSKEFHNVLSFEANGLTLNYGFFSILSKLTSKFEACMNTYS